MTPHHTYRLNLQAILTALISASFSLNAMASAGRVEFALGGAIIQRPDGNASQAIKGEEINSGDTIKTSDGRVQVRFTDGGYMSLQPNTEFKVEEYNFNGKADGTEKGFFRLIQGGLRAITGVVGHVNRPAYQVSTPVATIGIRGSEYLAEYHDKLNLHCNHGSIYVFNDSGNLILFQGQSAKVETGKSPGYSDNEANISAKGPAGSNPVAVNDQQKKDQSNQTVFQSTETRNASGDLIAVIDTPANKPPVTTTTASNVGIGYSYLMGGGGYTYSYQPVYTDPYLTQSISAESDSDGNLVNFTKLYQYNHSGTSIVETTIDSNFTGYQTDKGSNGGISWTRVVGTGQETVSGTSNGNPYTNTPITLINPHFIFGPITSIADMATLSATATYSFAGGTHPTDYQGNTGTLNSASLTADFTNATVAVSLALTMPAGNYSGTTVTNIVNAGFVGSGSMMLTQGSSSSSVGTYVGGFFSGAHAAQAGLSYVIGSGTNVVTGVAAFNKN